MKQIRLADPILQDVPGFVPPEPPTTMLDEPTSSLADSRNG
jgi:hypothetical protein